jgi:hypothetical protein
MELLILRSLLFLPLLSLKKVLGFYFNIDHHSFLLPELCRTASDFTSELNNFVDSLR